MTIKELAKATGKSEPRVKQLCRTIEAAGHAHPPRQWQFEESAVEFVKNLPDRRGKTTVKDKILADLIGSGIKHPQIWKGYSPRTQENGWHMCEFGSSEDIYLGKSWKEYQERNADIGG